MTLAVNIPFLTGLVALLAGTAWPARREGPLGSRPVWAGAVWGGLIAALALGALVGVLANARDLWDLVTDPTDRLRPALAAGVALLPWILALWIGRRPAPPTRRTIVALFALYGAVLIADILLYRPHLVSDAANYWEIASASARTRLPLAMFETPYQQTMHRRTVPYFAPLAALFGPSPWTYRWGNVALSLLLGLLMYRLARRAGGPRSAAVTLALLIGHGPLWHEVPMVSHELVGAFFFVAALLLLDLLLAAGSETSTRRAWMVSCLLGLTLYLLQVQRGLGWILAGTVGLVLLLLWIEGRWGWSREERLRLIRAVALPAALLALAIWASLAGGLYRGDTAGRTWYTALSTVRSDGSHVFLLEQRQGFLQALRPEEQQLFARTRLLFEAVVEPLSRPWNMAERAALLSRVGAHRQYLVDLNGPLHDVRFLEAPRALFMLILWTAVAWALVRGRARLEARGGAIGLAFSALLLIFLSTVGESGSRYLFATTFPLILLVATALTGRPGARSVPPRRWRIACIWAGGLLAAYLVAVGLYAWGPAIIEPLAEPPRVEVSDERLASAVHVERRFPGSVAIEVAPWPESPAVVTLHFPFKTGRGAHRAGLWLRALDDVHRTEAFQALRVSVGGVERPVPPLIPRTWRYVEIPLGGAAAAGLTIELDLAPPREGPAPGRLGVVVAYPWAS